VNVIDKLYALEGPINAHIGRDANDATNAALQNVLRHIRQLHSLDAVAASQVRPPLTPAKQAVADQNAAREAANVARKAEAAAQRKAFEDAQNAAADEARAAVLAKREGTGR